MKKVTAIIISIALSVGLLSVGIIELGKECTLAIEMKNIYKLDAELSGFNGKIENRLIVNSYKKKLDAFGAYQIAEGYGGMHIFQYKTKKEAELALEKFKAMNCVENADFEKIYKPCDTPFLDNDDAKCFATANSSIDDMIKLIKSDRSTLAQIDIAVIDSGCQDNVLTHEVVEGLGNTLGSDCKHGTLVCTTIINNTMGNVKIHSYDVGDNEFFGSGNIAVKIAQAITDNCKLINMSFGSYEYDYNMEKQIKKAYDNGIIMIAGAGNDNLDTANNKFYPACYSETYCIGAVGADRNKANFSNYGTEVNGYATGVSVRAMYDGEETYWNGTSAATPVALSVVSNIISVYPNITYVQLKNALKKNPSHSDSSMYSIIDGYRTMTALIGKSLSVADFIYDMEWIDNKCKVTFHCCDDFRIYYYSSSFSVLPINNRDKSGGVLFDGDSLIFDKNTVISAVAYGDNYKKSNERIISVVVPDEKGYTFDTKTCTITKCNNRSDKLIIVPSTIDGVIVKTIDKACFAGNTQVEEIVIPKSVTKIEKYAFASCHNLKRVVALGAVQLGRYAFEFCDNLRFVYFPSLTRTYNCTFYCCERLLGVSFPSVIYNSRMIAPSTFNNCNSALPYYNSKHYYSYDSHSDNGFIYNCSACNETLEILAIELKEMWTPYIIGCTYDPQPYVDSMSLCDVNNDGIINAKDLAVINKLASN